MSFHFADIARQAASDRQISADEILQLRRAGWADGAISREEADAIFAAQRAISAPDKEWSDFFVEAICQYVLHGTPPKGYASEPETAWLIEQVRRDERVCSMAELELLVQIFEKAQNVPDTLKSFVLWETEKAVLSGTGPTRCGGELSNTHVTETECTILRRVIFAAASDGPAAVSCGEAEMLFRIKDATLASANADAFQTLFVQGVGNYLLGFASSGATDQSRACARTGTFRR